MVRIKCFQDCPHFRRYIDRLMGYCAKLKVEVPNGDAALNLSKRCGGSDLGYLEK